jgi:hypothetical protein
MLSISFYFSVCNMWGIVIIKVVLQTLLQMFSLLFYFIYIYVINLSLTNQWLLTNDGFVSFKFPKLLSFKFSKLMTFAYLEAFLVAGFSR